ncbi:hypothetical protein U9M48_030311 [Paspalum notatum var. saurae]|uniref:Uncharacterized protein n=1 Tax=Paspalum notatum var. saurae TaxID=547442 RepID=A0AAQ3U0S7_PASNO
MAGGSRIRPYLLKSKLHAKMNVNEYLPPWVPEERAATTPIIRRKTRFLDLVGGLKFIGQTQTDEISRAMDK